MRSMTRNTVIVRMSVEGHGEIKRKAAIANTTIVDALDQAVAQVEVHGPERIAEARASSEREIMEMASAVGDLDERVTDLDRRLSRIEEMAQR